MKKENNNPKVKIPVKLADCPEEITEDGLKIYGETSLENQMAVLSHYLHGGYGLEDGMRREILDAIRDFIERKKFKEGYDWDDEKISMVAENPLQYSLFDDFFDVPFPAPENPRFTFIDLFAGIGGFRIAMQNLGGKCVYSSEFDVKAQETYFANKYLIKLQGKAITLSDRFMPNCDLLAEHYERYLSAI